MTDTHPADEINHERALEDLRAVRWTLQKARSVMAENDYREGTLAFIAPWIWGEKSLLPALDKLIQNAEDAGGKVDPMGYYNVLFVAHNLEPSIAAMADVDRLHGWGPDARTLPKPNLSAVFGALREGVS